MANNKSQIKRIRQDHKRHERNKSVRSEVKTRSKAALAAAGTDEAEALLQQAITTIDKAASKGVLHKNTAARRKSRLTRAMARAEAEVD